MASVERSLRVNITATTRGFSTAMQNAQGRLQAFERRLIQANNQIAKTAGMGIQANQRLAQTYQGLGNTVRGYHSQMVQGARNTTRASRDLTTTVVSGGRSVTRSTRDMARGFKDASVHAGAMMGHFENYAGFVGFQMLGYQAIAMGAAIGGAMAMSVKAFAEFEDTFALVRKTVQGSEAEFGALSDQIREMSREIPIAVTELNEVAGVAGQLGVPTKMLGNFTEVMAKMGVATNLTAEQAALSMARIANVMQIDFGKDIERMGATIVDLGNNFAAQEDEIVRFAERIAAGGQVVGMTTADILAFSTAFTAVGVRAERGGTAFQRVIFDMMNMVNEAGDDLELLAATAGMSARAFAQEWRESPAEAVLLFIEGLGRAGEQSANIMSELFGNNVRTTQSFLSLAGAGDLARRTVETGNKAWSQNIALNAEAEERFSTLVNRMKVFANQIRDVAIGIGQRLAPIVETVFETVTKVIEVFGKLPKPMQDVAMALGAVASAALLFAGAAALTVFPMRVLSGIIPDLTRKFALFTGAQRLVTQTTVESTGALVQNQIAVATNATAFQRAAITIRNTGSLMAAAGRGIGLASIAFAKVAAIAAVVYGLFKAGQFVLDRLRGSYFDTADAAEQLAASLGETLGEYQKFETELEDGINLDFNVQNQDAITALTEMKDLAQVESTLIRIGVDLVQRGMDPEKVTEAVNKLAAAAGRGIEIDFDFADIDPMAVVEELTPGIKAAAEQLSGTFDVLKISGHGFRAELGEIGHTLGVLAHTDAAAAREGIERVLESLEHLDNPSVQFSQADLALRGFLEGMGRSEAQAELLSKAMSRVPLYEFTDSAATARDHTEILGDMFFAAAVDAERLGDVELARVLYEMAGAGSTAYDDIRRFHTMLPEANDNAEDLAKVGLAALTLELQENAEEAKTAREAIEDYFSYIQAATDPLFNMIKATEDLTLARGAEEEAARAVRDAERSLQETREKEDVTADEITEAELKLEEARRAQSRVIYDQAQAVLDYDAALHTLLAAIADGELSFDSLATLQKRLQDEFGYTSEQANRLNEDLLKFVEDSPEIVREWDLMTAGVVDLREMLGITQSEAAITADTFAREIPRIRDQMTDLGVGAETASKLIEHSLSQGGLEATRALLSHLAAAGPEVSKHVATYAQAMKMGLDPVLVSIGGKPITLLHGSDVKLHRMASESNADGGIRRLPEQARIQPPGTLVQWAEPETGGEAFIPLHRSKRRQSLAIWAETGRRLGIPVESPTRAFADGGINGVDFTKMFTSESDVPPVPDYPYNGYARSAHIASEVMRQKVIDKINEYAAVTGIRGGGLAATKGLNPQFLARFRAWSNAFGPFSITSGYRSSAQQAILYARYKAGLGPVAAPPGRSMHEKGLAIDHAPHSWPIARTAKPFRLHHPVKSESWHVEPFAKGGILNPHIRDSGGPLLPGYTFNGTGKPEMVIPMADGGILNSRIDPVVRRALGASGKSAAGMTAAIEDATKALEKWERQLEIAKENLRRSELVSDVKAARKELGKAKNKKEREQAKKELDEATKALREFDEERARANDRRVAEIRVAQAREIEARRKEIEGNRESLIFDAMSTQKKIQNLEKRMKAEQKFTDAWMDLRDQRNALLEELHREEVDRLAEAERVRDELLNKIERALKQEADIENRRKKLREDAKAQEKELLDARTDALISWARLDEKITIQWGNTASAVIRNVQQQTEMMKRHREGLLALRERGLSEDVIEQLGLSDPNALGQVEAFTRATADELAELVRVVSERNAEAKRTAVHESKVLGSELNRSIVKIQTDLNAELKILAQEQAEIGLDQGITYAEAIAAGMKSKIPEIRAAAQELKAAQDLVKQAQKAVAKGEAAREAEKQAVAKEAATVGLGKPLPDYLRDVKAYVTSDGQYYLRTADKKWWHANGPGQIREMLRLYGTPSMIRPDQVGNVVGNISEGLFGGGKNMEKFAPRVYDVGGPLPPGLTMAYNGTRQVEYVLRPTTPSGNASEGTVTVEIIQPVIIDGKQVAETVTRHQGRMDRKRRVQVGNSGWER